MRPIFDCFDNGHCLRFNDRVLLLWLIQCSRKERHWNEGDPPSTALHAHEGAPHITAPIDIELEYEAMSTSSLTKIDATTISFIATEVRKSITGEEVSNSASEIAQKFHDLQLGPKALLDDDSNLSETVKEYIRLDCQKNSDSNVVPSNLKTYRKSKRVERVTLSSPGAPLIRVSLSVLLK